MLYVLKNSGKLQAAITNYGARVVSLLVPDKNGVLTDVAVGYDSIGLYVHQPETYFGAIVGRYGNRIAKGKFTQDGKEYQLAINNAPNTLHGGPTGFDRRVWKAERLELKDGAAVRFTYLSKDGEEGYPGNLSVTVRYTVKGGDLKIEYSATTDKDTVLNLTSHGYFNLSGQGNGTILADQLKLNASKFTPVDSGLIPTGELKPVAGTPFDFLTPHTVGERINAKDDQLKLGHDGYDHNFVVDRDGPGLKPAARVREPLSGRILEVHTTEPAVQLYSGNFLDGTLTGKQGRVYKQRYGFCLETQHYPDSVNHPEFPSTILLRGQAYRSLTVHRFSVDTARER